MSGEWMGEKRERGYLCQPPLELPPKEPPEVRYEEDWQFSVLGSQSSQTNSDKSQMMTMKTTSSTCRRFPKVFKTEDKFDGVVSMWA